MHLHHLCFVLPPDTTDDTNQLHPSKPPPAPPPPPPPPPKQRSCGTHLQDVLRNTLNRFLNTKRDIRFCGSCLKPSAAVFHDMDGVQFSKDTSVATHSPKTFTYSELYIGTKGFSEDQILGSGGFGRVYKAVLPSDGTLAAVKCLTETGSRFEKSFAAELVAVAHLRHRNLVPLRGWCVNNDQLLLVYDYMPNRSLDRLLFRRVGNNASTAAVPPLSWDRRMKIVKGLAAALFYLHEQLEAQIIHRDVKTSNVMLDSNFNARLGDFGLARWMEHELGYGIRTPSMSDNSLRLVDTTSIGGTIGYLPPESFEKQAVGTAKSDVFSFGIVLLEIASGRRAVDLTLPDDQIILLDRFRRLADEKMVSQAADSRLSDGSYNLHEMEHLIHLGLLCTLHDPQTRPSMRWIVEALSGGIGATLPNLPSFKSHPPYISVTRSTTTTTGTTAATATTITITASFGIASSSSTAFATAKEESLYLTAQQEQDDNSGENGGMITASRLSRRQLNPFLMVEPPREITYKEIISATDNFSDSNRLSEVDFGTAYYGVLDNHDIIVKRLGMKTCPALRVRFANELANLGRLRHRNLIQLRGWCTEQGEMLVVYDYSANRLLGQLLSHHNHRKSDFLRWDHRYNIVRSLACAIRYLHEEWEEQVIHRNITSSAIYIDPDMNPRLGSFALAEFLTRNEHGHHVVIDKKVCVRGIFGYMAPEYMDQGEATPMADVYSFGVVVLEVVSGRIAVDFRRPEVLLVKKVHEFESRNRNYEEIVDPRLGGEYNRKELSRLVKLAMACTQSNPNLRPTMAQIVSILDGHDRRLAGEREAESMDEWKERNMLSLSLIRRIQALGIQ